MKEIQVNLNVHEMGILLSALTNLEIVEEMYIAREYGSARHFIIVCIRSGSRWTVQKLD
jgi:hypothetical protein